MRGILLTSIYQEEKRPKHNMYILCIKHNQCILCSVNLHNNPMNTWESGSKEKERNLLKVPLPINDGTTSGQFCRKLIYVLCTSLPCLSHNRQVLSYLLAWMLTSAHRSRLERWSREHLRILNHSGVLYFFDCSDYTPQSQLSILFKKQRHWKLLGSVQD